MERVWGFCGWVKLFHLLRVLRLFKGSVRPIAFIAIANQALRQLQF